MKLSFAPALLVCACAAPVATTTKPVDVVASRTLTERSAAYEWLDILLEASARDVELYGARPTILSRQMAIPCTAMYDAWAAYDEKADGTILGDTLRRPASERTLANKEVAIAFAAFRTLCDQYPDHVEYFTNEMRLRDLDPSNDSRDTTTPEGIGNEVARALLEYRHSDGANQLGDEIGSNGEPYSDYTMYNPVNTVDEIIDPDRWQPIAFTKPDGETFVPGFLTAHWYRVKPFGLERSDLFRPDGPPKVGSDQMQVEVDEIIDLQMKLVPEEKALVEFMRDGPRSTAQSGHWLRFAQEVSRRDGHDLDQDVKAFFVVGNVAMDAFIAAWDAKRYYDSSRPWTLVHHYYEGEEIRGWGGPGQGIVSLPGEKWHPYSPKVFVTPPFPGYVSGHSCVSAASGEALRLFTGNDEFGALEDRIAGDLTEPGYTCSQIQEGVPHNHPPGESCDVTLRMPTFTETADMAGISRVMGGYHIQADNVDGLALGRDVARHLWPKFVSYFEGRMD